MEQGRRPRGTAVSRFFPAANKARSRFRRTRAACGARARRPAAAHPRPGSACAALVVSLGPVRAPGHHHPTGDVTAYRAGGIGDGGPPTSCGRDGPHVRVGGRPRTMKATRPESLRIRTSCACSSSSATITLIFFFFFMNYIIIPNERDVFLRGSVTAI